MGANILTTEELFGEKNKILTSEELFGKKEEKNILTSKELFEPKKFDEAEFQTAYKKMATKQGLSLDPDDPKHFYDYRALYKETGKLEPDETGHFPSKFKKEGHPRMEVGEEPKGTKITKLPSIYKIKTQQDIAKIMPKAEEAKPTMGAEYIPAKLYSGLVERPIAAMAEPISWALEKGFRALGLDEMADAQKEVTESYKKPPVTEKVEQQTAYLREEAYKESTAKGIGFDITEGVTQLMNLLTQVAIVKKLPGLKGKDIFSHFKVMAGHAVATTPDGLDERLQAAVYRMAYSMTPFIANWTGATGLTAVATDTALNVFLTSPTYQKAWKEAKNPEEFFQMAIPQLVMDIGMAWNTRGLPANQARVMQERYLKMEDRAIEMKAEEFQKASQEFLKRVETKEKLKPKILEKPKIEIPGVKPKPEVRPEVKLEIPKTKEEIEAAKKYGIPLEKVHITKVEKAEPEAEMISKLIKEPEPTKEELEFIEKGFTTVSKEEFIDKIKTDIAEEKLISPEGIVEGEKGSVFIPSMAEVQNIGTRIASKLSVEAPFIKVGAKETGFQMKNFYSNIGLAHSQGLKEINFMSKTGFKPVTVTESGFKASGELDYTDLTYLSERPGYFVKLTAKEKKMASLAKKSIKDFYAGWETKLKEIGWMEEPFPQSLITRNNKNIGNMKASLPRLKTPEARAKVKAEIEKLQDQNDRIKKQKIQFVSIPAKAILAKADSDPILRAKIMSILPHWGRTTITVKDLVDAKIITRKEADIRNIIGEYSDRMGRKYALGKIFENAEKEGLIKSQAEKPDWPTARIFIKGQHLSIPQLRGKRLDPFFSDVITDFFSRGQVGMAGVFGVIKMAQFYNPLFMPMYDVLQAAAVGVFLNPVKGVEYIAKGIKDSFLKTDNWERAIENGTMSKPFVIPYDRWENQFTNAMKDNKMGDFIKKAALPTNWIPMLYQASWHTAWKLDETVRMMTFNYLQDKGMSDREAGQLTALFHSDYASVPPATRKLLNKVLFTPTFKITMGKLYLNMLKGGAAILKKGTKATTEEKLLARGALLALAGMQGVSMYFVSQGYEEVEKFRKYVKKVETDEGVKENVITLATPFNIPWRYYYRVKGAFKPQTTNVAEKMLQIVKWDLHPIWRVGADVVDNYNWNVYNPFDKKEKIALDVGIYATGEFVKITKSLLESAKEGEIKADAFKAMQKDFGRFKAVILKPFVFNYLRERKAVRKSWAIKKLEKEFRLMMLVSPSKDAKENYERLQNFNERMKEIMMDFK